MKEFVVGLEHSTTVTVTDENTAKAMGSGSLDVFATPAMVALMEKAAVELVQGFMENDETTVGTKMDIEHISSTPLEMQVTAAAKLVGVDGRCLTFEVTAVDEVGVIGKGIHKRFVINSEKFMKKTNEKNGI